MWTFFLEIWAKRPHYCQETGRWLGYEPKWTHFHHLIHKAPYPQFKHKEWNIVLLHPDIHELAHQNLDAVPKVKALTELAWKESISI